MPLSTRTAPLLLVAACSFVFGCTGKTAVAPNPFVTTDRVPPPAGYTAPAPAAAPPYYQGAPPTFAPGTAPQGQAPAFVPNTPVQPAPAAPYNAPAPAPGSAAPVYGAPAYGGTPPLGSTGVPNGALAGDRVAIPGDGGSLRFANGANRPPVSPGPNQPLVAATAPERQPAMANGWIAGAAPIRSTPTSLASSSPRVRMPSGQVVREPISIAALDRTRGGVAVAPLEPAPLPTGPAQPGEPAPLRIASPSTTGWR